jgi:hypothetical protein
MPRIVRGGPSVVKGTRRSFLTASQKGSRDPPLSAGASAAPAGLAARARPEASPEARAANLRTRDYQETGEETSDTRAGRRHHHGRTTLVSIRHPPCGE